MTTKTIQNLFICSSALTLGLAASFTFKPEGTPETAPQKSSAFPLSPEAQTEFIRLTDHFSAYSDDELASYLSDNKKDLSSKCASAEVFINLSIKVLNQLDDLDSKNEAEQIELMLESLTIMKGITHYLSDHSDISLELKAGIFEITNRLSKIVEKQADLPNLANQFKDEANKAMAFMPKSEQNYHRFEGKFSEIASLENTESAHRS